MKRDWKKMLLSAAIAGATVFGSQTAFAGKPNFGNRNFGQNQGSQNQNFGTGKHQVVREPLNTNLGQKLGHDLGNIAPIKPLNPTFPIKPGVGNGNGTGGVTFPLQPIGPIKTPGKDPGIVIDPIHPIQPPKIKDPIIGPIGPLNPLPPINPLPPKTPPINPNPQPPKPNPNPPHGHHCGNNVWWKLPLIWWYPHPNYCVHICPPTCVPVYPINEVTVIETVTIVNQGAASGKVDVILQSVGFVDAGDVTSKLGPRYRVTIKNNSTTAAGAFNVMMMTGLEKSPKAESPTSLVKIEGMEPGQVRTFDVRLPVDALTMGRDAAGQPAPFANLFVAVDSHEQLADADRGNNGAVLARTEIPAVPF